VADINDLERRIAQLEQQIGAQAAGGGQGGGSTPAEWIAGTLARSLQTAPGGPLGQGGGQAPGSQSASAQGFTGDSSCWCTSRFVCATMSCNGSNWC